MREVLILLTTVHRAAPSSNICNRNGGKEDTVETNLTVWVDRGRMGGGGGGGGKNSFFRKREQLQ